MILGVPTLYRYGLLDTLLVSAYAGRTKPSNVLVIDNGGGYEPRVAGAVRVERPGRNIGVAAAWNRIMQYAFDQGDRGVIISNDDAAFGPETFADVVNALETAPLVLAGSFVLFGITRECVDKVGWFDERFWPAYHEDIDYMRRVKLAGLTEARVAAPPHHEVSATLKGLSRHSVQFIHDGAERNRLYYEQKWGGPAGAETFTTPFGGQPPPA